MTNRSPEIDAVLAGLPDDQRTALEHLRATIAIAAPDAVEAIAYGVPAFRHRGRPLVSFGATKRHCAFYVQSPAVVAAHASELASYDTSKGTVRFMPDRPIPDELLTRLVVARIAETDTSRR